MVPEGMLLIQRRDAEVLVRKSSTTYDNAFDVISIKRVKALLAAKPELP